MGYCIGEKAVGAIRVVVLMGAPSDGESSSCWYDGAE